MAKENREIIRKSLRLLYGEGVGRGTEDRLIARMDRFVQQTRRTFDTSRALLSQKDVIVISYGDMIRRDGEPPLRTLYAFFERWLADLANTVHILPFFPYSSDDGFSVIDFTAIDPDLGTWQDLERFKTAGFRLMFDAVINHISVQSEWFQAYLDGDPRYRDYFIQLDPSTNLSQVTRPRAHPLLTPISTVRGKESVWTTFSPDQADLNYKNPDTLLDVIDVLLTYIDKGADILRLDAIAYLWKEIGTTCIHLPQTHAVVQLLRGILNEVAPGVFLITETNVPHEENISYFGNGMNEAHMVYNFTLPPLTAHAILTGNAEELTAWTADLAAPGQNAAFLNFTASHDGIGLVPARGILDELAVTALLDHTLRHGGALSYKTGLDGSTSPYELNISYFDLLNGDNDQRPLEVQVDRFMVSQAIMLALAGIPAIYLHSLLGSRNYKSGVEQTGKARSINREKLDLIALEEALTEHGHLRRAVFQRYRNLLRIRSGQTAFHPNARQKILPLDRRILAIERQSQDSGETILAVHNLSPDHVPVSIPVAETGCEWEDLCTGHRHPSTPRSPDLHFTPYQFAWLKGCT